MTIVIKLNSFKCVGVKLRLRNTIINYNVFFFFFQTLELASEQWDSDSVCHLYCWLFISTRVVFKFLTWNDLCPLNKGLQPRVCRYKMLTCSIHLVCINHRSLTNHFLDCPWPCPECSVCRNQETCEAICWESAFDHFPPSSCRPESNITHTYIFHTHASVSNFGHRGTVFKNYIFELFKVR